MRSRSPTRCGCESSCSSLSFPVLAVGVAGYLAVDAGAGPTEAAALAFDPPVPFKWSYSVVQGGGALLGWLCGAAVGPGTLLVIFLLGPLVDLLSARFPVLSIDRSWARQFAEVGDFPGLAGRILRDTSRGGD